MNKCATVACEMERSSTRKFSQVGFPDIRPLVRSRALMELRDLVLRTGSGCRGGAKRGAEIARVKRYSHGAPSTALVEASISLVTVCA